MLIKAAVLEKLNTNLKIRELSTTNLVAGQVLIKIYYSGICRSQLMEIKGKRGVDNWLPHLLGHEATGVVMNIGPSVTKFKLGDKVILGWIKNKGIDAVGAKYKYKNFIINSGPVSTFSNYSVVSENRLTKMPPNVDFKTGVLYGCAILTGAGLVLNEIKPKKDLYIAALGIGGIGLAGILALKAIKHSKVIIIDKSLEKLKYANSLGFKYLFNKIDSNVEKKIRELTNGGVDYCIESAGSSKTIEFGFKILNQTGELYFASHPPTGNKISIDPHELISGKKIYGTWGGSSKPEIDIKKISKLFFLEKIDLNHLISKEYALQDINKALYDLEHNKVFRPLIKMSHD